MTLPLLIREMLPEEKPMVLSDWKKDLKEADPPWGKNIPWEEWWALINHVVDRITLPSATVLMACHRNEPSVPLCWVAVRDGLFLHMHARTSIREDPELAVHLEKALLSHAQGRPEPYNPFMELKR